MEKEIDLTEGSIWNKLLLFALPISLMNVLQQLFNTADIAVVGQLVGNDALAAVGCTSPIVSLFIAVFSGLAIGSNAIIARRIGEKNSEMIRQSIHSSIAVALVGGLLIMVIGEIITRPLLTIVSTPDEAMDMAVRYLRIYFAGSVFIMLYNFGSAILRAGGDTKRPLYILILSGVVNILLNLFFVLVCRMKVEGVALATLISNIISAGLVFWILVKEKGEIRLQVHQIRFYGRPVRDILMIGVPSAAQGILFNIANIVIQSGINSLGSNVVAGSTVGMNVEIFLYYIVTGFGQACITFNGQNLGAGKAKRCVSSTRWCLGLGLLFTLIFSGIVFVLRRPLAGLFTPDADVVRLASYRIALIAMFEGVNLVIEVLSGALRGLGHSFIPAFLSAFLVCGVRIFWLVFVFPLNRTFEWLLLVYPISWGLAAIGIFIAYLIVKRKLLSGSVAFREG